MRRYISGALFVLFVPLLVGCGSASALDPAKKAAEEQAAKEQAERDQARREREKLLADARLRDELKNDFEHLLGRWDYFATEDGDKPRLTGHLEINANSVVRLRLAVGSI